MSCKNKWRGKRKSNQMNATTLSGLWSEQDLCVFTFQLLDRCCVVPDKKQHVLHVLF